MKTMTKTVEQVVAEALDKWGDDNIAPIETCMIVSALREAGMLREARPVIDREAVAREVYRELYPGSIGTHDSARTPESDLAEADRAYQTWDSGNEGFAPGVICRRVADRVIAHLEADTVDDRTEWDYDVVQRPEDCTTISSLAFPTLDKAKKWRQHMRNMGHGDRLIMRRRKAGEWEEIPNE